MAFGTRANIGSLGNEYVDCEVMDVPCVTKRGNGGNYVWRRAASSPMPKLAFSGFVLLRVGRVGIPGCQLSPLNWFSLFTNNFMEACS